MSSPPSNSSSSLPLQVWQQALTELSDRLRINRYRVCVVLVGEADWRNQLLKQTLSHLSLAATSSTLQNSPYQGLEITDAVQSIFPQAQAVSTKQLAHHLGQETDFVIFSAEQGIDANALGQASGMIRVGGICWLSLPEDWCEQPNPANARFLSYPLSLDDSLKGFNQFLWQGLQQLSGHEPLAAPQVIWINQTDASLPTHFALMASHASTLSSEPVASLPNPTAPLTPTPEQQQALAHFHSVGFGHRHRPLVLIADRGRGKSALLGIAAIELLLAGKNHIAITAARLAQVTTVFTMAEQMLKKKGRELELKITENLPGRVCFTLEQAGKTLTKTLTKTLEFLAPDDCLANPHHDIEVLMVDEAAHLPMPMLMQLAQTYNRLIFATTQQGYEGSGRGFTLKFQATLKQQYPQTKTLTLNTPIRWADNDPLENSLNQCLLFADDLNEMEANAPRETIENAGKNTITDLSDLRFRKLNSAELVQKPSLLKQVFHLLTQAHYQTAPNDLMQLLETPNQHLWIAETTTQVLGVLFGLEEGELPPQAFWEGHRYQGHLFPQLLALQNHHSDWLTSKTLRIVRLAVLPEHQQQGIGSQLLNVFCQDERIQSFDAITTSFGATPCLVDFWQKNGFKSLHIGLKQDKASGSHSLAMALALSPEFSEIVQARQATFTQQFLWLLTDSLQNLPTDLAIQLLTESMRNAPSKIDAATFPIGYLDTQQPQPFEAVAPQLKNWTLANLPLISAMEQPLKSLWIQRVLQNQPWETLVKTSGLTSRKQLEQRFKQSLGKQ